ncbi:MAG: YciI family protein [Phreatobacter sp.]
MRFMMFFRPADSQVVEVAAPQGADDMAVMGKLIGEMAEAGVLLATEGLMPTSAGMKIRQSGGKITVIDGPFTEAKELIAGFRMVQVKSKADVIGWGKRFFEIVREDGESEIRQPYDLGDAPCAGPPLELAAQA